MNVIEGISGSGRGRLAAEQAKATVESDREVILGLIQDETGLTHFNRTIRDKLQQSFELVAVAAAQRSL